MKKLMFAMFLGMVVIGFCSNSLIAAEEKPLIQMAILLDTSGSMTGLIDQARAELWSIVNQFAVVTKDGKLPELQVALYEYGKSSVPSEVGYIRMIVPFTTDLDKISEELFALTTNGGEEYCGWVIKDAVESLEWSSSPDDLKVIFIAGNEPFTQGPVDYRQSCKAAISKAIVVNTIHCGTESQGIDGKWNDGSLLADGKCLNIDHNYKAVYIEAPQDAEIAELSGKLNDTYIYYGVNGEDFKQRQTAQDNNAAAMSREAAIQRTVSKSSVQYENSMWDLVDALQQKKVELEEIDVNDLPEEMTNMTVEERENYVKAKSQERLEISGKIQQLNEQRNKYIAEEQKKQQNQTSTLGSAIIEAISEQAKVRNFEFSDPNN
jgi:hypothetical protein